MTLRYHPPAREELAQGEPHNGAPVPGLLQVPGELGSHGVQGRDVLVLELDGHLDQAVFVFPVLIMPVALMPMAAVFVMFMFIIHDTTLLPQRLRRETSTSSVESLSRTLTERIEKTLVLSRSPSRLVVLCDLGVLGGNN